MQLLLFHCDRFRQISGLINVESSGDGGVVSNQLQDYNRRQTGEKIVLDRYGQVQVTDTFGNLGIFFRDQDHVGISRLDLADIGDRLVVNRVLGCECDNRDSFLNQGDGAMF